MKKQIKSLAQLEVSLHNANRKKWEEYKSLTYVEKGSGKKAWTSPQKRAWLIDTLRELNVDPRTIGITVEI